MAEDKTKKAPAKAAAPKKSEGKKACAEAQAAIAEQSKVFSDQETTYVTDLTNKYCARF